MSVPGGNPLVFGEIRTPGATRTIVFYAHYDGQPLDPEEWATPPFQPTLRDRRLEDGGQVIPLPPAGTPFDPEWRLYARGAADDKAPIIALMTAIDAIRAAGIALKSEHQVRIRRRGGGRLAEPRKDLAANKELFAADLWLMCDAPVYQTRQQSIIFGARGGHTGGYHRVWPAHGAPQRPLRELGAQSGDVAGAAARIDEGRQRPRARRALL